MTSCPKDMVHGPCGGVRPDGGCEVGDLPCVFVHEPATAAAPAPAGGHPDGAAAAALRTILGRRPIVVASLPTEAIGADDQRAAAAALAGHADAALLGDAPWARVQLPPAVRARILAETGVPVWAGLNCRDRNRVALEGELLGLADAGAAAVHCVTGDHPASGDRPDATPVFDLDAPRLVALAAGRGMLVSAAEAPAAPPAAARARRAALKAQAGAEVIFVNHASAERVDEFTAELAALAPGVRCIASVPLAISSTGAQRLLAFAVDGLPAATSAAVAGGDPVGAGIRAAIAAAEALLALPHVHGVNVGAAAAPGESIQVAAALGLVGEALGGGR